MFFKAPWCVWKSPVRIIVEVTACWQCPSFRAWQAGARFFRGRAATPYLNPARCEPTFAHRHGAGARSVAETQTWQGAQSIAWTGAPTQPLSMREPSLMAARMG
jgi:hypothetical protein